MIIIFIHTVLTIVAFFCMNALSAATSTRVKKSSADYECTERKCHHMKKKLYILTHRYWPFFVSARSSTIFRINFLLCVPFSCVHIESFIVRFCRYLLDCAFCRVSHCIYSIFMGTVYSFVQRDDVPNE